MKNMTPATMKEHYDKKEFPEFKPAAIGLYKDWAK